VRLVSGRLLLTGGAGFMGSALARTLSAAGWQVTVLDLLTYAGRRENLDGVDCELVVGDVCDPALVGELMAGCDAVVHAAAESHVTRSLRDEGLFTRTNVGGTRVMLNAAQAAGVSRFLFISTDEVFGQAPAGVSFGIEAPMKPGNPYAASKVGAEAMVHAWRHSFDYPAAIIRCTNNYGPRQHPEKAIPCWTLAAMSGGPVPVHGEGRAVRDWLHVEDFSRGIARALERWRPSATWHFAGRQHRENRELARFIADELGGVSLAFGPERQGQDSRYDLDDAATRAELDWAPTIPLEDGLRTTVAWVREHRDELEGVRWS